MVFLDGFAKLMGRLAGRCLKGADEIRLYRPVSDELFGLGVCAAEPFWVEEGRANASD